MDVFITRGGLWINYKTIKTFFGDKFNKFLENYVVEYKTKYNTKKIRLYSHVKTKTGVLYLTLPRFALVEMKKCDYVKNIKVTLPKYKQIDDINYTGVLNHNQQIITNYILNELYSEENKKSGMTGGLIQSGTGTGKTYMGIYIISKLKVKTMIICPNNVVLEAWKDDLKKSCDEKIYTRVNFNDISQVSLCDINIMLIQSAIKFNKSDLNDIGLIIYDEIHKYCTDVYHKIFELCQFRYVLGLSATPNHRIDGFDKIAHLWVGNVVDATKLVGYENNLIKITGCVKKVNYENKFPYKFIQYNDNGGVSTIKTIQHICEDPKRTNLILNLVLYLLENNKCIYVFSEERKRTIMLNSLLRFILKYDKRITKTYKIPNYGKDKSGNHKLINSLSLIGNYSNADFILAKTDAKVIFTTYALLEAGANIPKQTAMILDTPRKNGYEQIVGRIKRQNDEFNHIERIVIDVVDTGLFLRKQFEVRKKAYEVHKFKVDDIDQSIIDNAIDFTKTIYKYKQNYDKDNLDDLDIDYKTEKQKADELLDSILNEPNESEEIYDLNYMSDDDTQKNKTNNLQTNESDECYDFDI